MIFNTTKKINCIDYFIYIRSSYYLDNIDLTN